MSAPKWSRYGAAPDYCPDGLTEEVECPACGAAAWRAGEYCLARHNGPRPRALVDLILVHRDTGERI